jgi:hypothetical protein
LISFAEPARIRSVHRVENIYWHRRQSGCGPDTVASQAASCEPRAKWGRANRKESEKNLKSNCSKLATPATEL